MTMPKTTETRCRNGSVQVLHKDYTRITPLTSKGLLYR